MSHGGECTIITRDAIRKSARSAVWSVPRSGVAGCEVIAVLFVTKFASCLTCHRPYLFVLVDLAGGILCFPSTALWFNKQVCVAAIQVCSFEEHVFYDTVFLLKNSYGQ